MNAAAGNVRMLMNDRERLHRYFDGELPAAEKQAFDANADHDEKEKLLALEDVRRAVKTTVDLQTAGIDLTGAIDRELDRQDAQKAWRRRARWASPLAAVAAVAAAVMIWMKPAPLTPIVAHEAASIESLEVQGAMASVLDLDDENGSATVIWIDEEDEKETL